ncbi:hypothetical protein [Dactylosporangium sp. NPDC051484]|uniref:hypothetical protein n=1 Tax=Dactylosporangium sp. NPDC051484 TaxID=3154942 RepID=UPI00344BA52C
MAQHGRRRRRLPAAVLALLASVATVFAAPAPAYPFGVPQTVVIASDPGRPDMVPVAAVTGAVLLIAAGALVLSRRLRRAGV